MEVLLLGTGSADGWPNPFCTCPTCAQALAAGEVRGQTAALVDGALLLDCGPEVPRAALLAGRSLADVRVLLFTHGHPDHVGPAALLFRAWAGRREPLDVVGPAGALDQCRDWCGPDDPVRFVPVQGGDDLALADYRVRVLAAAHGDPHSGDAVLYDLTGPDGGRLLYATDTATLPDPTLDAVAGRAFDLVLLEETFGTTTDHGTDHLDLATFPLVLAELRRRGAVVDATDVVAVHLSHHNPPAGELAGRLAGWGARVVPDGTVLLAPNGAATDGARRPATRRTLVLGGARSGKSAYAEQRLAARPQVTLVATARPQPDDPEWAARVAAHRVRRPAGWRTLETDDLVPLLRDARPGEPLLVDCLALWLAQVLDDAGTWTAASAAEADAARAKADAAADELVAAWRACAGEVLLVSNEVGSGLVPASESGRRYRDDLGWLNARLAAVAEEVVLVVAGVPVLVKAPEAGAAS